MMTTKTEQIGFRIEADIKKQLEELAKDDGRPLSNYLQRVLKAHVEEKAKKGKKR